MKKFGARHNKARCSSLGVVTQHYFAHLSSQWQCDMCFRSVLPEMYRHDTSTIVSPFWKFHYNIWHRIFIILVTASQTKQQHRWLNQIHCRLSAVT